MNPEGSGSIDVRPVKSFFVDMLTRDIALEDAILDLLDNCVDGTQRTVSPSTLESPKPYSGFRAQIDFSSELFSIEDNCGGIPWELKDYAFRLGRPKSSKPLGGKALGTYGIGLKRAIFKMGRDCTITTHASDASYQLRFSDDWMSADDLWSVEAEAIKQEEIKGTRIIVRELREGVAERLKSSDFEETFRDAVATQYAYIIGKGFEVLVNGKVIEGHELRLLFAESSDEAFDSHRIEPYIYETEYEGVSVFVAVGFTSEIASKEEADESQENYQEKHSPKHSGWTVVCNDRTVLYCDKTETTGWGVSGVPQHHMQFNAISGIAIFTSDDPSLLPTNTTKRGIEMQSKVYLHVRDRMIEGTKIFTAYTNRWKSRELVKRSREEFRKTTKADLAYLRKRAKSVEMSSLKGPLKGRRHSPELPKPNEEGKEAHISFKRRTEDVQRVSRFLFDDPTRKASDVGGECFDLILKESRE